MARSARCVERWYSAIASSGPTSATERTGERSQSTTSISAADAMNANGTMVARTCVRIS